MKEIVEKYVCLYEYYYNVNNLKSETADTKTIIRKEMLLKL
jgi:hypothetical protein